MGQESKIEWTDHTFNPWWGCTKVSPGCKFCYAETLATRWDKDVWGPKKPRRMMSEAYWKQPERWNREAEATGVRRRVFCASMADVFEAHDTMPAESFEAVAMARIRLLALIASTPNLDWQLLTKRPKYARFILGMPKTWDEVNQELFRRCRPVLPGTAQCYASGRRVLENVWMGTSVENQNEADERIPELLQIPAKVRFLSCEPLIGPVDLDVPICDVCHSANDLQAEHDCLRCVQCDGREAHYGWWQDEKDGIHWVICGGESGHGARPMNPEWARSLRDQCTAADVPFFFKQWGEWAPIATPRKDYRGPRVIQGLSGKPREATWEQCMMASGGDWAFEKQGKKYAGRSLDGRTWDEFPKVEA